MKWLGERPRSIVEAWNILCEALNERIEFYGYCGDRYQYSIVPTVPCRKSGNKIREMLDAVRTTICRLTEVSYDWTLDGTWRSQNPEFGKLETPTHPLFDKCGVDGYAFFRKGENFPSYSHSSSEFIKAAAGLLDFAVRYPSPKLCNNSPVAGFGLEASLEAQFFEDGSRYTGSSQNNGCLVFPDGMHFLKVVDFKLLSYFVKDLGRARSYGHRCIYNGGEENGKRLMPLLTGKCDMRVSLSAKYNSGVPGEAIRYIDFGEQEFVIDLDSGKGDRPVDFSAAAAEISEIWNSPEDEPVYSKSIDLVIDSMSVRIGTENFQPLTYKYME